MGGLSDFLQWKANIPDEAKSSTVPTNHKPMSAEEFRTIHDGSLEAMIHNSLDSALNTEPLKVAQILQGINPTNKK